jgi:hypothetical protein
MPQADDAPSGSASPQVLTVNQAADAIAGLMDSKEPKKAPESKPEADEAPQSEDETPSEAPEGEESDEDTPEPEGDDEAPSDAADEDEEATEELAEESAPPAKLKLDDGTEITLDEARKGYLRQSDYTRKTTELGEKRREAEAFLAQTAQIDLHARTLAERAMLLIQQIAPEKPDPRLIETDQFAYHEQRARWEAWNEWTTTLESDRRNLEHAVVQRHQQNQQNVESETKRLRQEEAQKLLKLRPELKDRKKFDEFRGNLMTTLPKAFGIQPEEIVNIADHRLLLAADAAARYYKLTTADRKKAIEKGKDAPPVQTPGKRTSSAEQRAKVKGQHVQRLRRSGRVEDAARAIMDDL